MCLAIPGKIVEISSDNQDSALVDVVGVRRNIDLGLLQDDKPVPGDWVLIHVGFAMSKISEQDAADQMSTLRVLGEIDGAMQEVKGYGLEDVNWRMSHVFSHTGEDRRDLVRQPGLRARGRSRCASQH
jgi:hydrogenase expression/formation protein HypC